MQIWPAIDIRAGKCVRLRQGDYQQETVFGDNPAEMGMEFVRQGARCLHVVDLDGAKDGSTSNFDVICELAESVNVPIQVGGGVRDTETVKRYVDSGINRLIVGTRALNDPKWLTSIAQEWPNQIVLGLDARDGMVATDGWLSTSNVCATEFAGRVAQLPIAGIIYTDIAKDGMLEGPNFVALMEMNSAVDCPVIASGGVTSTDDVSELASYKMAGCIIGRALYEGLISIGSAIDAAETGMSKT